MVLYIHLTIIDSVTKWTVKMSGSGDTIVVMTLGFLNVFDYVEHFTRTDDLEDIHAIE